MRLLAVTYLLTYLLQYNAVIVTENHLRFVAVRHIVCERLVNVKTSRVHVH